MLTEIDRGPVHPTTATAASPVTAALATANAMTADLHTGASLARRRLGGRASRASGAQVASGGHQGDGNAEPELGADRCDLPAGLHRGADGADAVRADVLGGGVEVLDVDDQAQNHAGAIGQAAALDDLDDEAAPPRRWNP